MRGAFLSFQSSSSKNEEENEEENEKNEDEEEAMVTVEEEMNRANQWEKLFAKGVPALRVSLDEEEGTEDLLRFFLLRNLTTKQSFHSPNLMDMKCGTFTPPPHIQRDVERFERHRKKYTKKTTSHALGLRICGRRCWYHHDHSATTTTTTTTAFHMADKYWGRTLDPSTFFLHGCLPFFLPSHHESEESLARLAGLSTWPALLHPGSSESTAFPFKPSTQDIALCVSFREQVEALASILSSLPHINFYSVSLLLLYEGHPDTDAEGNMERRATLKMIDFAHVEVEEVEQEEGGERNLPPHTQGLLFGLQNLIQVLTFIEQLAEMEGLEYFMIDKDSFPLQINQESSV